MTASRIWLYHCLHWLDTPKGAAGRVEREGQWLKIMRRNALGC